MRGIEIGGADRGVVPPLQGGGDLLDLFTRGFTPGYHIAGFQPEWTTDEREVRESEASHLGFLSHPGFQTSEFALTSVPP